MRRRKASSPRSAGIQVGGEDQEGFERRGHLAAGEEAQVIDAALHGHDPAVQHFGGSGALAAEVVDQVDAVVGLELERRLVDLGGLRCSAGRACPCVSSPPLTMNGRLHLTQRRS